MNIKIKIYLIVGIMALAVFFLVFGAIKPLFYDIKKTAATAEESRDKLISLQIIDQGYLDQVEADYQAVYNDLGLINRQLLNQSEAVKFFESLESMASQTENQLEIDAYDFPELDLRLAGSFPNLMKFIGLAENGNYFLTVNSVNISKASSKEDFEAGVNEGIKTNLRITVYTAK